MPRRSSRRVVGASRTPVPLPPPAPDGIPPDKLPASRAPGAPDSDALGPAAELVVMRGDPSFDPDMAATATIDVWMAATAIATGAAYFRGDCVLRIVCTGGGDTARASRYLDAVDPVGAWQNADGDARARAAVARWQAEGSPEGVWGLRPLIAKLDSMIADYDVFDLKGVR